MNKKGQMDGLGMIIIVAVTLIVGVVFFQVIAQEIGSSTNTVEIANQSLTAAAVNDTLQYIINCRALSSVVIINATGTGIIVDSGNYTITNDVINPTTSALSVSVNPTISATPDLGYGVGIWKISGTCQPLTYIADSGGRAVTSIILIFFALAIVVVAISPTLRSGLLDWSK